MIFLNSIFWIEICKIPINSRGVESFSQHCIYHPIIIINYINKYTKLNTISSCSSCPTQILWQNCGNLELRPKKSRALCLCLPCITDTLFTWCTTIQTSSLHRYSMIMETNCSVKSYPFFNVINTVVTQAVRSPLSIKHVRTLYPVLMKEGWWRKVGRH